MMQDQNQSQEAVMNSMTSSNVGFNNPSIIMYRLDTMPTVEQLRTVLSGQVERMVEDSSGNRTIMLEQIGTRFANDRGIHAIIGMIVSSFNSQVVQGNISRDHYSDFMFHKRCSVMKQVVDNCYEWGIQDEHLNYVIDLILDLVEIYLTRPIDNKEKESYAQSLKTTQTSQEKTKAGWTPFGG